ncbi:MAG: thioredoxin family protein [Terracidiphilus sp.]|jgi:thiol:disulfide interchange protein DsbD
MRFSRSIFAIFFVLAVGLPARAASSSYDDEHVHIQLVFRNAQRYPGAGDHGGLYFKLEPGWHVYWMNPGDAGLPPHIHWTLPEGVTAEPLQFTAPKRLPLGPLMDFGYENEVLYPFRLAIAKSVKPGTAVLHAKVDWLVCRGSCIPGKADLEITQKILATAPAGELDDGPGVEIWKRLAVLLPDALPTGNRALFQPTKEGFRLTVETGRREKSAEFFPEDQDILDNSAPQKLTPTANGFFLDLKKDANLSVNPNQLKGVLELSGGRAYEIVALPPGVTVASASLSEPALVQPSGAQAHEDANAANAGVQTRADQPSANLSESANQINSSVANQTASGSWAMLLRISGLAFLGGLLLNLMPCVFPVLFLKGLALVNSGNEERARLRAHGFVYAAGILVSFWALVGALLGLRAAGATLGWGFQFQSPVFLALMAGLLFFLGLSLAGQFEIGLTLTSAGGSLAAKHGYTGSFFTGVLAVVVATPCTAPFMGAAVGYALAQSPAVTFAVFTALALGLAAPYVALTLQPAWTRWLPKPGAWMEVLRQAVAVPIFATVIWLAWVLAQAYGASVLAALLASFLMLAIAGWFLGRWPARRWATTVAALILLGVIAIAVVAPQKFAVASQALPDAGVWQPWSQAAVSRSLAAGQPVFVDFTASWCLSCQVNERVALSQPEVEQAFQARNVVLMKADWTRHDEAITQALTALGRSGVPAYALYTPGESQPQMLPEVLTPGIVMDALSKLPKPSR